MDAAVAGIFARPCHLLPPEISNATSVPKFFFWNALFYPNAMQSMNAAARGKISIILIL